MNKIQKPAYHSPGLKTINLTPRSSVCDDASLAADAIEAGILDKETGEYIEL